MRQFTTPEQTAKLIELGYEKPRYATMFWRGNKEVTEINYTIGELIEMLPKDEEWPKQIGFEDNEWVIDWDTDMTLFQTAAVELIDALFEMVVKQKEKGVI